MDRLVRRRGAGPGAFEADGLHLVGLGLSETEVRHFYEGFCNATLWPLYHDVIAPPQFHRRWWEAYVTVNRRFAQAAAEQAAPGATVWVHDYQLQLVPRMLREQRDDVRIGFFNHIPFPGYEIFAQLPWRRQVVEGLLGADLLGFQRRADATNFLRACRRAVGLTTKGSTVRVGEPGGSREIQAAAFPISIDAEGLDRDRPAGRRQETVQGRSGRRWASRAWCCWAWTGSTTPRASCTGCGPTASWSTTGRLGPRPVLIQVASPSRERVEAYQTLRDEVEVMVGRINGQHGEVGYSPVHYLHQSFPREEMAALYLAADVMLVTPLRDGMNLVAKEYVAARYDEGGTLVLSEFTGAADELAGAFLVNPHDIEGMKNAIVRAATPSPAEARRRMRAMRRRVREHDVARWAASFLDTLRGAGTRFGSSGRGSPRPADRAELTADPPWRLAARQFAERDLDVAVLAVAADGHGDLVAGLGGGQGLGQRGGVGGLRPGDRGDHVAGAKPGPFGPSTAGHGDHADAARGAVRAEDGRDLGPDRGPVRVGDVPGVDDLGGDVAGQVGRDGEADALGLAAALRAARGQRRDADHLAGGADQRAAAVARVDRGAGLDRAGQRGRGRAVPRPAR